MADYLIIAPSKFHNDLEGLREIRAEKHRVQLVDPTQIYAVAPKGSTREESIQGFVRDIYRRTDGQLKYLLLVGDDTPDDLPEEIPVGKYNGELLSDAFYGNITGDDLPEIVVGRLPADSAEGVRNFVAKILEYESGAKTKALQNRLSFYAGVAGFGPVEDLLLEAFVFALLQRRVPKSYELDMHYDGESKFNTRRSFLEMLMEAGAFSMTYMGHGAPNLLATEPPFGAEHLGKVAIEGGLPLLNLMACSAGCFANNDCLGEQLALLRHGPATVIGSNEIISPPVLQFFGDRMAEYLEKNGETTIGDVFLHAQQNLVDEKDFLWRIFKILPTSLAERAGLKGELKEGVLKQGLQMSLMGDPALTWRVSQGPKEENKNDARLRGPQTGRMRERIRGESATATEMPEELSTKTLHYDDLETVLSLVDYLLYRVPDLVGRDKILLPKPGSVTLDHGLVRVPFDEPVTVSSNELPPYLKQLFFPSGMGALRFEKQFSFSAAFQNSVVALDDITGVTLLPDNNEKRSLLGLKIDLSKEEPRFESKFGLPPISEAEATAENAHLEKLFEGQPVKLQIEWEAATQSAAYILLRKPTGNGGFVRERKLFRVDANHLPTVLGERGILLTLPYGTRIGYNSENSDLVLNEVPAGEKTQSYLLVPFASEGNRVPQHDPDEAIRTEIYEKFQLKDRPVADTVGGTYYQWPLYGFYVHKEPPTFQNVSFGTASWSKGPLFERKPDAAKATSATPEESPEKNSPEEDSSFSWSGLNRTGADVCMVLDGSGSMGRPIERAWKSLREKMKDVPSLIRPFIKGALVAVQEGEVLPLVGELTRMTESGVEKFDRAIRDFPFQGKEGDLQLGIEACRKIVKPNPDGSVYRGIFVLSDSEGLAEQHLKTGFGIEAMAIDRALDLPKIGDILKLTESGNVQKYLTDILTRSLVPEKRAAAIAETMAPYAPTLREDEKMIWEMAVGYAAQQKSSQERIDFFEQHLSYGAVAEKSERVTEMIVAAAGLLPMEEFNALMPQLEYLQNLSTDGPLKEAVKKAKENAATSYLEKIPSGKFREMTDLEMELTKRYYQETIRDPESVPLKNLEKLLVSYSSAVDALVHIVKYGTIERQLEALRILTDSAPIWNRGVNYVGLFREIELMRDVDPHLGKAIRNFGIRLGIIHGVEEEK